MLCWVSIPGASQVVQVYILVPDVAVGAVRPELHSAAYLNHGILWVHYAIKPVCKPVRPESATQSRQVGVEGQSPAVNIDPAQVRSLLNMAPVPVNMAVCAMSTGFSENRPVSENRPPFATNPKIMILQKLATRDFRSILIRGNWSVGPIREAQLAIIHPLIIIPCACPSHTPPSELTYLGTSTFRSLLGQIAQKTPNTSGSGPVMVYSR